MKYINIRYILIGIFMGLILLMVFVRSLPDGRTLTIVFCDVGQGDSAYLRFPDGRDMLIDGGPDGSVLQCLGKYKPFWNRHIDILLLTHPDADHFVGFTDVAKRYSIGMFLRTSVYNTTPEYGMFHSVISDKHIPLQYLTAGDRIQIGQVMLSWIWPTKTYLETIKQMITVAEFQGVQTEGLYNRNSTSQVIHLRYGTFDALFTGDADIEVESNYIGIPLTSDNIEILKVPHHGSKTGMSDQFLEWLHPETAIISVGRKNWYMHPSPITLEQLEKNNSHVFRTDIHKHIVVVTDGIQTTIKPSRKIN